VTVITQCSRFEQQYKLIVILHVSILLIVSRAVAIMKQDEALALSRLNTEMPKKYY